MNFWEKLQKFYCTVTNVQNSSEEIAATQMHQALAVLHQGKAEKYLRKLLALSLQQTMYNISNAYNFKWIQ